MVDLEYGSACYMECGAGTPLQNLQSVTSHELFEAITDPLLNAVRICSSFVHNCDCTEYLPSSQWFSASGNEIMDLCNQLDGVAVLGDSNSYVVQK